MRLGTSARTSASATATPRSSAVSGTLGFAVALLASYLLNQAPFLAWPGPSSVGADGDSYFHVAIQMKLQHPGLFPGDVELNQMYMSSRPSTEFMVHRGVALAADEFTGGDLITANIIVHWAVAAVFLGGVYLLAWMATGSALVATIAAGMSAGLSPAVMAWWGVPFGAVIPHDVGLAAVPWMVIVFVRWRDRPGLLVVLFGILGLLVSLYPLQPIFLGIMFFLALFRTEMSPRVRFACAAAAVVGAAPALFTTGAETLRRLAVISAEQRAAAAPILREHYAYLFPSTIWEGARTFLRTPLWFFLAIGGVPLAAPGRFGLDERTTATLRVVSLGSIVLSACGVFGPKHFPVLVNFLFHRASAFVYLPAYIGCATVVVALLRSSRVSYRVAALMLVATLLGNATWNTAAGWWLRGRVPPTATRTYAELVAWAKSHTDERSTFLIPFHGRATFYAFRVRTGRGVFLHDAAGEIVLSDPRVAPLFTRMSNEIFAAFRDGGGALCGVATRYGADYVISERPVQWSTPPAFHNDDYFVYSAGSNDCTASK